jgi:hypothetical protein
LGGVFIFRCMIFFSVSLGGWLCYGVQWLVPKVKNVLVKSVANKLFLIVIWYSHSTKHNLWISYVLWWHMWNYLHNWDKVLALIYCIAPGHINGQIQCCMGWSISLVVCNMTQMPFRIMSPFSTYDLLPEMWINML